MARWASCQVIPRVFADSLAARCAYPLRMAGYTCASCGARHEEVPLCFLSPVPATAAAVPKDEWEKRVLISSDQCIVDDESYFILNNLNIPIINHNKYIH